jgi:hypothetical protein
MYHLLSCKLDNIYDHSESSDEDEDDEDRKTEVSISRGMKNVKKCNCFLISLILLLRILYNRYLTINAMYF